MEPIVYVEPDGAPRTGVLLTPERIRRAVLKVFGNASVKEVDALVAELSR